MTHLLANSDSIRARVAHFSQVVSDLTWDVANLYARLHSLHLAHSQDFETLDRELISVSQDRNASGGVVPTIGFRRGSVSGEGATDDRALDP